jgi:hypothetical protein
VSETHISESRCGAPGICGIPGRIQGSLHSVQDDG